MDSTDKKTHTTNETIQLKNYKLDDFKYLMVTFYTYIGSTDEDIDRRIVDVMYIPIKTYIEIGFSNIYLRNKENNTDKLEIEFLETGIQDSVRYNCSQSKFGFIVEGFYL